MKRVFAIMVMVSLLLSAGMAMAEVVTLTGTVQQVEEQFVLTTDDGTRYVLEGNNLSGVLDQKITVSGDIRGEGDQQKVAVTSYEPVK
ncbi:MAG: hypothetical protein CSA22_01175 [Deltaproteobacteria bacterium]|nr:MAG: hypothetical protein CSA22_01175 [Deltaproteobacteria bacterium]